MNHTEEELKAAEEHANGAPIYGWRASHKSFLAGVEYQKGKSFREDMFKAFISGFNLCRFDESIFNLKKTSREEYFDDFMKEHYDK